MHMKTITLEGTLGATFGVSHRFNVLTAREAVKALCQRKGFEEQFRLGSYLVKYSRGRTSFNLTESSIDLQSTEFDTITFTPVVLGASDNPVVNIVIGALIFFVAPVVGTAVGSIISGGTAYAGGSAGIAITSGLTSIGTALVLTGVAGLLSPQADIPGVNDDSTDSDYLFTGPQNTTRQGVAVPIVFGHAVVGSVVVSRGVVSESLSQGTIPVLTAIASPSRVNGSNKDASNGGGRGGHNNGSNNNGTASGGNPAGTSSSGGSLSR